MAKEGSRSSSQKVARPDPLIGREVARCRIEAFLDHGKSAAVYRGTHLGMQTTVAIKILKPEAVAIPAVLESFRTEARAIARLDSENVVKVYDVVDEQNLHCMVMELLDGESVLDLIQREERLSQVDSLRIIRQAALGMKAAHERGIVHRDVKPQNLVVMPDGTVKLVDFGLAVEGGSAGGRVGTPHYVAPETASSGVSEPGSDVYSLGISFFHLLVGQPPFAGKSVKEVVRAHIDGEDFNLAERRTGLSRPVLALFADMTRCDPLVRLTSAQVVERIDAIGGKRLARKSSLARRGRRSTLVPLVAVAALVVAAGLAFLVLRGKKEANPNPEQASSELAATTDEEVASTPEVVPVVIPTIDPAEVAAKAELAARMEEEAQNLLGGAESWARANWHGRSDTAEVLKRYRAISGPHRKTEAAKEARRRIDAIEAGELHPHPDRSWSSPAEVEAARKQWEEGRGEVRALVAAHRYREALAALPPAVSDPWGELESKLEFQRARIEHILRFPAALSARLAADPDLSRALETSQGKATVKTIDEEGFEVVLSGADTSLRWEDVDAKSVARLAVRALVDADLAALLPFLAFCSAHELRDAFFQATMTLDLSRAMPEDEAFYNALRAQWK